jgi:hypothetical protein
MVVARALPLQVIHAQTVQQHQQARRGLGQTRAHREAFEHQVAARVSKRHRNRQRIVGGGQMVAQHAIERSNDGFALGTRRLPRIRRHQLRDQPAEQRLGAAAHHARDAAHRLVHQAREAARALRVRGRAAQGRKACDTGVHRLDEARQAGHRVGGQAGGAAQVGGLQERLGHGRV